MSSDVVRPVGHWLRPRAVAGFVVLLLVVLLGSRLLSARQSQPGAASVTVPSSASVAEPAVRTADGAAMAAVQLLATYGSPEMYDAAARSDILDRTTSPQAGVARPELDRAYALAGQSLGLDEQGQTDAGELVARTVAVGTKAVSYSPNRAVVSVWTTGLLGVAGPDSRIPVQESWSTETVTLMWTEKGWLWAGLEHQDGPAPVGSPQVPASAEQIAAAARDFQGGTGAG